MVLSEYSLSSFKAAVICFSVTPLDAVFALIVAIDFIFCSYSPNPSVIGSIAKLLINFFPAFIALFVMFDNTVAATTPIAENLAVTVSTPLLNPLRFTLPAAFDIPSKPLPASFILSFSFNCLRLASVVLTPDSNPLLLNCISTILLSIELMR